MTAADKIAKAGRPLGAHMSTSGSFTTAVEQARTVGANAVQIFTKSQLRWQASPLKESEASEFKAAVKEAGIKFVCAHNSYIINLASTNPETRDKSLASLIHEVERSEALGCACLVMHPGSPKDDGVECGLKRISDGLRQALKATSGCAVMIALENTAGQGATIGVSMEEIRSLMDGVDFDPRLRMCLDTCHAFAAGYDIRKKGGVDRLVGEIESLVGLDRLMMLHLNDSKKECGSNVDRHENIGEGFIGAVGFKNLFADKRLLGIPGIIETPKEDKTYAEEDTKNLLAICAAGA